MSATRPAPGPAHPEPAERFGLILDLVRRTAAAKLASNRAATPILLLLWSHLHRLAARFASLVGRVGRPTRGPRPPATAPTARVPRPRLPTGFGWLARLVPETRVCGSQLQYFLSQPEVAALLEAEPRFGRMLRPLCRMLAIPPPPQAAPPRPRVPENRPAAPPVGRTPEAHRDPPAFPLDLATQG